jgi:hypothetical protein
MRTPSCARWLLVLVCVVSILVPACSRSRSATPPDSVAAPPPAQPTPTPAPPPPPRRTGRLATEELLQEFTPGKTTRAEVRERLGVPNEVVLAPGTETFIYYRERRPGWFSRQTERVEMLTIRFDAGGMLKDFEYRYSGTD